MPDNEKSDNNKMSYPILPTMTQSLRALARSLFLSIRVVGLVAVVGAFACGGASGDNSPPEICGPFGDPSAAVISEVRPSCSPGKLVGPWKDYDGIDRYACLYQPKASHTSSKLLGPVTKLPMIVYLHPSLFSAGWITLTNLLNYQDSVSLTGDPKQTGYIVLAPEGRKTTHYYPFPDNKGIGWDNWYRQLNPAGEVTVGNSKFRPNVDALAIDHFIAEQVAAGSVDTARIYISGWSNGAAMAILYALNRPAIASAAVYSAPNPFGALVDSCPQTPVAGHPADNHQIQIFNPHVPTMHIHNACDISGICPNGEQLTAQLRAAGVSVDGVLLDSYRHRVDACSNNCGTDPNGGSLGLANIWGGTVGTINHARWPSDWTPAMLDFFRSHPLKTAH